MPSSLPDTSWLPRSPSLYLNESSNTHVQTSDHPLSSLDKLLMLQFYYPGYLCRLRLGFYWFLDIWERFCLQFSSSIIHLCCLPWCIVSCLESAHHILVILMFTILHIRFSCENCSHSWNFSSDFMNCSFYFCLYMNLIEIAIVLGHLAASND